MPSQVRRVAAALVVGLGLFGCSDKSGTPFSPILPGPSPDSPSGVLRLFEWCYDHRNYPRYTELFTADFRFLFSALDTAGQGYRDVPWTRDDELISVAALFRTATDIRLTLDQNFNVVADPRPGKDPKWHKTIRSQVVLNVRTNDGSGVDVTGFANFFVVRGDSALIPDDLVARGFVPDSTRWYIERWEDQTALSGGLRTTNPQATRPVTWGALKVHYRDPRLP
jgi:hypothetical protein